MIVSNASPLITFAKVGKIDLVLRLYDEIFVSDAVKQEVIDNGKKEGYADALLLEDYLRNNKIKVIKPGKPLCVKGLHRGEAGTIALALELGVTEVLIDENDARVIAKVYGLNPRGTLFILFESGRKKIISEDEAVETLDEMLNNEFRISSRIYSLFLDKIKNERQRI